MERILLKVTSNGGCCLLLCQYVTSSKIRLSVLLSICQHSFSLSSNTESAANRMLKKSGSRKSNSAEWKLHIVEWNGDWWADNMLLSVTLKCVLLHSSSTYSSDDNKGKHIRGKIFQAPNSIVRDIQRAFHLGSECCFNNDWLGFKKPFVLTSKSVLVSQIWWWWFISQFSRLVLMLYGFTVLLET